MGSLADRLKKATSNDTGAAVKEVAKAAKAIKAEIVTESEVVLRTEADIKDNPIYKILNNESGLDDAQIVDALGKMLARDKSLSKEENELKIAQFGEFNRYYQDQMVSLAQKLAEFSHDDALSMYDDTVEGIKKRLGDFKGDIEPLVRALKVIREAEASGKDPHALIEEVQKMTKEQTELQKKLTDLNGRMDENGETITDLTRQSDVMKRHIERTSSDKDTAQEALTEAEASITGYKGKFLGSLRFKSEIQSAEHDKWSAGRRVSGYSEEIKESSRRLEDTADKLSTAEKAKAEMGIEHAQLSGSLETVTANLQGNDDYMAISKLLEITGNEYKGKREGLVGNAQKFIEDAIIQFNGCIDRFTALEGEIQTFSHAAQNIVDKQYLLIAGSEKAYKSTQTEIDLDVSAESRLAEEEKDLEFNSSAREKLITDIKDGKVFLNAFLPTRDSVVNFRQILASREAEFTALSGLVQGKRLDAEELRTNGAVAVASQLVMTLKSLEAAVAGQKTDMLRDMLADFTSSARQATDQVLGDLVKDQKGRNVRLDQAITDLVDMQVKIDDFSDNLLQERITSAGLTEAIIEATDRVVKSTEDLANTVADGRREAKEQIGKDEAKGIVDSYVEQHRAGPSLG